MTNEERENAIRCLKLWIEREPYIQTYKTCLEALEQQPCIQEKQANADKIDAVYIDGFKAGYSQARFDLEQQPCDDAISRQAVLKAIDVKAWEFCDYLISKGRNDEQKPISHFADNLRECVREELPPVNPQEPKTGHWIKLFLTDTSDIDGQCSECGFIHKFIDGHTTQYNYCPNCGCRMVETQESEKA